METYPYMGTVSIYGNTTVDVFPYMETVPIYGYVSMYVLVCPTVLSLAGFVQNKSGFLRMYEDARYGCIIIVIAHPSFIIIC